MELTAKIGLLLCCISVVKVQDTDTRWGIINGRLVDTFDDNLDRMDGGSFVGGVGAGVGLVGGAGINFNPGRPGDIRNLYPCQQLVCSRRQIFPPRCEYTPVLRSSLTGGNCLGCPEDICQQVSNIDLSGGNLGVNVKEGGRNRRRGGRRRRRQGQRRTRRIQRQACRLLGICNFPGQDISRGRPGSPRSNVGRDVNVVVGGNIGGFDGIGRGNVAHIGSGFLDGTGAGVVGNIGVGAFEGTGVGIVGNGGVGSVGRVDIIGQRNNIGGLIRPIIEKY